MQIVERLRPELHGLAQGHESRTARNDRIEQADKPPQHGSLWSVPEMEKDSGLSKGTWYKWVNQRRIPVVRFGRRIKFQPPFLSLRIEDVTPKRLSKGGGLVAPPLRALREHNPELALRRGETTP